MANEATPGQFDRNGGTELQGTKCNGVQSEQGPQATSGDTKPSDTTFQTAGTYKDESRPSSGNGEAQMCVEDGLVDATPQVLRALDLKVGRPKKDQQCDKVPEVKTPCEDVHDVSGQDHEMAVSDKNEHQKSPASSDAKLELGKQTDHPKKAPRRVQLVTLSTKKS